MSRRVSPTPTPDRSRPSVAWLDGRVVPWSEARLPIEDRGLQFAEALYEGLPVVAGSARFIESHAARMRVAAELLGLAAGVPADERWREIAAELIAADAVDEGFFYAQLTGGTAPRRHARPEGLRPTFFAYVRCFRFPRAAEARHGLRVMTADDPRWARSALKTTMLLPAALARGEAERRGLDEVLWFGAGGRLREGTSSNVFLVEGGRLVAPQASEHILPGITGPLVAEQAARVGLSPAEEPIDRARVAAADEVFLSATTRLAAGIVEVDGRPIGNGRVGERTLAIAAGLRRVYGLDSD